jgi:ABC-type microcin C transport system duplicated ATPase subunit YejF
MSGSGSQSSAELSICPYNVIEEEELRISFELRGKLDVNISLTGVVQEVAFDLEDGNHIVLEGSAGRLREVFTAILESLSADEERAYRFDGREIKRMPV